MENLVIYKLLRLFSLLFIVFLASECVSLYIEAKAYKEIVKDTYKIEDDSTAEIIKEQRVKLMKEQNLSIQKPFKETLINGWR